MTTYLELLHERGLASADHTTLLLNCYTKSKDVKKLDTFLEIDRTTEHPGSSSSDVIDNDLEHEAKSVRQFDVETAVRVLRSSEYFDHALAIAKRSGQHELYVAILLEDLHRFSEALQYVRSLEPMKAAAELKRYGRILVTALPDDTTSLLMYLCTVDSGDHTEDGSVSGRPRAVEFIHCFVERQVSLMVFLEFIYNSITLADQDAAIVYETLLDLYLTDRGVDADGKAETGLARESRHEKAIQLLRQGWLNEERQLYNVDQALLLCQMRQFKGGLLFLYENMGMHTELLRMYKEDGDYATLLDAVVRIDGSANGRNPQMWMDLLEYFATCDDPKRECESYLKTAISHIEENNILPPLVVLQLLSKSSHVSVAVVKDYIARVLETQTKMIEEDFVAIQRYREETDRMQAEIDEMTTQPKVFQLNKCSICSTPLDLPAVHFYCMHSFHQRCLGDNDNECPICSNKQRQIATIRANLASSVQSHDKFYQQLENSDNGFDVVAEFFSRGLFVNN